MIGIAGAGVMGIGVAQCFLEAEYTVIMYDNSETVLKEAEEKIIKNIKMKQLFQKDKSEKNIDLLAGLVLTSDISKLKNVDVVIENIQEDFEEKRELYLMLEQICKKDCVFMVNTSCISITKISGCTERSELVVGTHFMNPVPLIDTVEVIRGFHTSERTLTLVKELLGSIKKRGIVVNDTPGFVANRISHLMMNEAVFLLQEQTADAVSIDQIFKQCYGHKMGPLETADLIGLDTVVKSLNVLYESFQDSKFRCCPLLIKMVDAGLYGRKSGQGFYTY